MPHNACESSRCGTRWLWCAAAAILLTLHPPAHALQDAPPPAANDASSAPTTPDEPETEPTDTEPARAAPDAVEPPVPGLLNPALDQHARIADAQRLLAAGGDGDRAVLIRALAPDSPAGSAQALLQAVLGNGTVASGASGGPPPSWLIGALGAALPNAGPELTPMLLEALSRSLSRDAIEPLIAFVQTQRPPEKLALAFNCLRRQSGREDIGPDAAAWAAWWREVQWIPEGEWRLRVGAAHAARGARLARERQAMVARVVDLLGRLHTVTPVDQRSPLLASMLRDELVEVRLLGVDFASRALVNAQPLDASVTSAAFECLTHVDPLVRAGATRLLENLAPEEGRPRLLDALMVERDPRVAAPLLRLLAKRPSPAYTDDALRWLEREGPARDAAADSLLALHRANTLADAARTRSLSVVRGIAPERLTPGVLRLMGALGDASDAPVLQELLGHADRAVRLAAAEALAAFEPGVDPLLRAAATDTDIIESAARAVIAHRRTATGYRAFEPIARGAGDRALDALRRVALSLPLSHAAVVAETTDEPGAREAFILSIADRLKQAHDEAADAARLVAMLADLRLRRDDASGALAALDMLANREITANALLDRLRLHACLSLDRLDDAAATRASLSDWLDWIEPRIENQAAVRAFERASSLFGAPDGGEAADRYTRLATALRPSAPSPTVTSDASPDPDPAPPPGDDTSPEPGDG